MSYEAMTWAVKIIEQNKAWKTPIRFVLLIMANRADEDGALYPSVRWIIERTALGESTIRDATRELQRLGLLIKEPRQREQGGQTSNEYRLAMSQFALRLDPGPVDGGGTVQRGGGAVQSPEGAPPRAGPQETKDKKKERKKDVPMPDGFGVTPSIREWAKRSGFESFLQLHLDYLVDWVKQNPSDWCADWDARLRNSIRADWGGVRKQAQIAARAPGGISSPQAVQVKRCAYCPKASTGNVSGIEACDEHTNDAYDRKPREKVAA